MKVIGFWVLFLMLAPALIFFSFSKNNTSSSIPDVDFAHSGASTIMATSRKLKGNGYINPSTNKKRGVGKVNLDDYHPIDPPPSSKASVSPGAIQHGSPLNPYIPKPSPPPKPSLLPPPTPPPEYS
ncbi:hypothetical protein Dsin_003125 [Dipteronia sinensis]|uniref:Uncharacterized protein n=1 Tax=Dipteronia sinensis TaxID=43782 RepID=A0AAE0B8W7_9ROSI|nr:hypothetical protein Dsin_003125 [Dipteronia sinensis]